MYIDWSAGDCCCSFCVCVSVTHMIGFEDVGYRHTEDTDAEFILYAPVFIFHPVSAGSRTLH